MFLLSLALSFSMNHGGLFDVYLEEVVWKVNVVKLERRLNYI